MLGSISLMTVILLFGPTTNWIPIHASTDGDEEDDLGIMETEFGDGGADGSGGGAYGEYPTFDTNDGSDICYGPTDEIDLAYEMTEPLGNENCDLGVSTGIWPQIDPETCEPICYGPTDEIVPCDEMTESIFK